jgi:hypothetical protein
MDLELQLDEREPEVVRTLGGDETATEALVRTFDRVETTGEGRSPSLYDQVDPDALDELLQHGDRNVDVRLTLWGRPVVVTPRRIEVYATRSR